MNRHRWTVTLTGLALVAVALAFAGVWTWGVNGIFSFQPPFADTVAILAAGEARHAGLDIYQPIPFDPLQRPHVYGPGWLVTGGLGLTVHDAGWIGTILVIAFIVTAAWTLGPRRPTECLLALALLCSPPVLLGIARANNDLVLFLLFAVAAWLLDCELGIMRAIGGAALGLAAVLKLYPLAALPVLLWRRPAGGGEGGTTFRRWWNRVAGFVAVTVGCVAVVWWWRDDFQRALQVTPNPATTFAYGFPVTLMTLHSLGAFRNGFEGAWLIGFALAALLLGRRIRQVWTTAPRSGFALHAFVIGGLAWTLCYFAIRNYPYRFVLVLLPARTWLLHSAQRNDRDAGRIQVVLWAVIGWLDVVKHGLAPIAAADPTLSKAGWSSFKVVIGFEQGLLAALTLVLLTSTVGAFARLVRQWCASGRAATG